MAQQINEGWLPYTVNDVEHPGVLVQFQEARLRARILPGGGTIPHQHSGTEIITIISGRGVLFKDGREIVLLPGLRERILPNIIHSIRNDLQETLEIEAVFDPPFDQQTTTFA